MWSIPIILLVSIIGVMFGANHYYFSYDLNIPRENYITLIFIGLSYVFLGLIYSIFGWWYRVRNTRIVYLRNRQQKINLWKNHDNVYHVKLIDPTGRLTDEGEAEVMRVVTNLIDKRLPLELKQHQFEISFQIWFWPIYIVCNCLSIMWSIITKMSFIRNILVAMQRMSDRAFSPPLDH